MKTIPTICSGGILLLSILASTGNAQYTIQEAFPNLSFISPVDLRHAGDGSDRLFVVEKRGVISVFQNDPSTPTKSTFLDIEARVDDAGSEEGLLGLVFHPEYTTNGFLYVYYTASGPERSVISRFEVTADPDVADPASELVLLEFSQPYTNHNGGSLAFGPDDRFLYVGSGDGGSFGDPQCRAQNLEEMLGKILRIDVDNPSGGKNYGIPVDNPYYGNAEGYLEEIYASGMRNPWRFSFDPETGLLWCGDVGQNSWEEIDIIENGGNYGWAVMEGNHCYASPWACAPECDPAGLIPPVWEYSHTGGGFSITGGYVYHGSSVPELEDRYIYADYVTGRIWSLEYDGINPAVNTLLLDSDIGISTFGVDEAGELYLCDLGGTIYTFTPTIDPICSDISSFQSRCVLGGNGPKAQFRVILSNSTQWAGETIRFAVGDDTISTTIETNGTHSRALAQLSGLDAGGSYAATMVEPANCFDPIEIVCPTSAGSADANWDELDRLFGFAEKSNTGAGTTGLTGNSPNPFNPSTVISYSIGQQEHVTLTVFNLLGQEIIRLVDRVQEPGSWTATWNGRNADGSSVSSGVYLYRLTVGSAVYTSKMLLAQ